MIEKKPLPNIAVYLTLNEIKCVTTTPDDSLLFCSFVINI